MGHGRNGSSRCSVTTSRSGAARFAARACTAVASRTTRGPRSASRKPSRERDRSQGLLASPRAGPSSFLGEKIVKSPIKEQELLRIFPVHVTACPVLDDSADGFIEKTFEALPLLFCLPKFPITCLFLVGISPNVSEYLMLRSNMGEAERNQILGVIGCSKI